MNIPDNIPRKLPPPLLPKLQKNSEPAVQPIRPVKPTLPPSLSNQRTVLPPRPETITIQDQTLEPNPSETTPETQTEESHETSFPETLIHTGSGKENGLDKCVKCGSTDITYSMEKKMLTCADCRFDWLTYSLNNAHSLSENIETLVGRHMGGGAQNITAQEDLITIKCQGCGAEIVLNTVDSMHTECHWCRQSLTLNQQIPNGSVPDGILPFLLTRDEAVSKAKEYVGRRKLLANKKFLKEFNPENIRPVYMPYMIVDARFDAEIYGIGEIETSSRTKGSGDDSRTVYSGDRYQVSREMSITVDDLTIESNQERADLDNEISSNNIINAILPFDTENIMGFSSHYIKGATSERRDMSFDTLDPVIQDKLLTIARMQASKTVKQYDRGVRWESELISIYGTRWISAYLPVWLYSYVQEGRNGSITHYIAVNGRTGATMGSIPVNSFRLFVVSGLCASPLIPLYILFTSGATIS